jgi:endonuclease YncB( thermonuclease family)
MSPQPFHLPRIRLSLLIRSILGTTWDEETWPTVKTILARALRMRQVSCAKAGSTEAMSQRACITTRSAVLTAAWVTAMVLLAASAVAQPWQGATYDVRVWRVIDGDTIQVLVGDRVETVRYIGINTPEIHHPTRGR